MWNQNSNEVSMTSINKVSIISHHFRANPTAPERQAGRVSQAGHSGGLSWDELAALRGRGLNRDNWLHGLLLLCLQWESVDVSLFQVMACRLFGAKPLPEPVEEPAIWNVMRAMLRHCNNNAAKRDFGITNDYISNERVWRFALLLARICYWTNSRATGDWKHQDAHVASL